MQPFLNAFPLPNGPDNVATGVAEFNASYSNSASLDAYSIRVDHRLNSKISLFGRYNYSPSKSIPRGNGSSLNTIIPSQVSLHTATAGATWTLSSMTVNDLRFNYSRVNAESSYQLDNFGGAIPLASLPFPSAFNSTNGELALIWASLGTHSSVVSGFNGHNLQRQINLIDDVSIQKRSHTLKLGIDYRRLSPEYGNFSYFQEAIFNDVPSSTSGNVIFGVVSAGRGGTALLRNLGMFGQDTWRATSVLTVTYGVRWDVDFSPSSDPPLLAVTGFALNSLSNLAPAVAGTQPFETTYGNFAPRIGVAYQLARDQNWKTVLRGGFGVFYDLATSEVGNSVSANFYPFGASKNLPSGTFPFDATTAVPPAITAATLPSSRGFSFDPNLKLPYTLQWNIGLEQALGPQQSLSASYIGAAGRRLLQTEYVIAPNANFHIVQMLTNAATSDYDALQLQFQRRLSRGLQTLASYTWSHSIDTASAGSAFGNRANGLLPSLISLNRGPSDFDIRHAFSVGTTYQMPVPKLNAFSTAIMRGWSIDSVFQALSAPPVNVFTGGTFLSGQAIQVRPNVVTGQPYYLYGAQYPGGKAFNSAAFVKPPAGQQGNLGRNALRAFGATQWDFAVHRDFPVRESLKLQFRAEMFNILNHPNFGPPINALNNASQFGLSTQTLGQALAGQNLGSGAFNPLYQIGGPRSVQFALKFLF